MKARDWQILPSSLHPLTTVLEPECLLSHRGPYPWCVLHISADTWPTPSSQNRWQLHIGGLWGKRARKWEWQMILGHGIIWVEKDDNIVCLCNQLSALQIHLACASVCVCARACTVMCASVSMVLFNEGQLCNTLESLTSSGPAILLNGNDGQTQSET